MSKFGDGSDGAVNFTTTTKTYGNLVENTDYKVVDDDLFLKVDRVYNFTDFTLGTGTVLKPWFPSGTGTAIYIKCTGTSTIDGDAYLNAGDADGGARGDYVETTWATGEDEGTLSTPGVANGGSGGNGGRARDTAASGGVAGSGLHGYGGGGGSGGVWLDGGGYTANGGSGGAGGASISGGAGGNPSGSQAVIGDSGSSSGGAGGSAGQYGGDSAALGGNGGGTHGANGSNGVAVNGDEAASGGGGAGGLAGYSGMHFILKAVEIIFSGEIITSGTSAGSGGDAGTAQSGSNESCGGSGGGGGGTGGNAGDIEFTYQQTRLTDTGTKTMSGGGAGSGGTYSNNVGPSGTALPGSAGSSGSSGSAGSYTGTEEPITMAKVGTARLNKLINKNIDGSAYLITEPVKQKHITGTAGITADLGYDGETSMYVKYQDGVWHEVPSFEYFKVMSAQNQVAMFEVKLYDIQAEEKAYVKELAEIMFFSEKTLIMKGRIQKVTYETAYECFIEGFGPEATILDKEFIKDGDKRKQYDNESAQEIALDLLSENSDGVAPWIMQPYTTGLFDTDYGNISMRFEYGNRLNSLSKVAEAINYEWRIKTGLSFEDNFELAPLLPSEERAKVVQETFDITGPNANVWETTKETDIQNTANKIDLLGYGDGINQLHTSTYSASTTYSTLAADINDSINEITIVDGNNDDFDTGVGEIRIMEERITYTSFNPTTHTFSGCSRGTSGTTALPHKKEVYVEKYVSIDTPEEDSSIEDIGLLDYTIVNRNLLDLETAELICSHELLKRKDPIIKIMIKPNEPLETVSSLELGDRIQVNDSEADISDDYRIVKITYVSNYGDLELELEASNRSLSFIEQMQKQQEAQENLQKYMQGATNIYALTEGDNCDGSNPLNMKVYIPSEAIAINKVNLNFTTTQFRAYETGASSGGASSITSAGGGGTSETTASDSHNHDLTNIYMGGDFNANSPSASIGFDSNHHLCDGVGNSIGDIGVLLTGETTDSDSHTHGVTIPSHTHGVTLPNHTHGISYGIFEDTFPAGTPKVELKVNGVAVSESPITITNGGTYEVDITTAVTNIGAGNWITISFTPIDGTDHNRLRVEANAYVQVFIDSTA